MKITAEKDQQSQYIVRVEIDPAELKDAKTKAAKKLSNKVRIPGFRPGKAPASLVQRVVGEESLLEEATRILLPQAYTEALKDADIKPIADPQPNIESLDPLTIVLTIPVEPTVTLGDYQSIKEEMPEITVTDEEVDKVLQQLRDQNSTWEEPETERPAQEGDKVEVELVTLRDGETLGDPFIRTGVLGKGELLGQIDEQVTGMAVNEVKVVEVNRAKPAEAVAETAEDEEAAEEAELDLPEVETIPDDDAAPMTFQGRLVSIKVKNEPALDDAFAASVSELQTLDELKARVRKNLVASKEDETKRELVDKIVKEAVDRSSVIAPPVMIDSEIHALEDSLGQRLKQQKLTVDQYLAITGKTHEDFHEELRPQAISRVNTAMVLREIAKAENITVTDSDITKEIEKMVADYTTGIPEDQRDAQVQRFKEVFSQPQMRDQFSENVFSRKLAERLLEIATGISSEVVEADSAVEEEASAEAEETAEA